MWSSTVLLAYCKKTPLWSVGYLQYLRRRCADHAYNVIVSREAEMALNFIGQLRSVSHHEWCDLVQSAVLAGMLHKCPAFIPLVWPPDLPVLGGLVQEYLMTPPPSPSLHVALQLQMAGSCPAVLQSLHQVCSGVDLNLWVGLGSVSLVRRLPVTVVIMEVVPTVVFGVQHVKLELWCSVSGITVPSLYLSVHLPARLRL